MKPSLLSFCLLGVLSCMLEISPATAQLKEKDSSTSLDIARQLNEAFVQVAEKVSPAVVVIDVVQRAAPQLVEDNSDNGNYEAIPRGPAHPRDSQEEQPQEKALGQGSGVIIREDGYILTNEHVVEDAEKIQVHMKDGRTFKATLRGLDPQSDLAVIKIDAKGLPVATLADSTKTRVGEFAIAIGAPFSLEYTVTYGHVSAKGRSNVLMGYPGAAAMDQDFIQTDANINPGNSGGPLVNINSEVIGINTLIRGLHTGIGFAIPSSLAREISDRLIVDGKFTRAWLGVSIRAFRDDPDYRELLKGVDDGVVIQSVMPDGPAARSDLKPTDVITAVDGKKVSTPQELRGEIRSKKIGQQITLDVFRAGKNIQVKVKPAEWADPATTLTVVKNEARPESESTSLGISIHGLNHELARQFGVDEAEGVIVLSVDRGTPAARQGMRAGDIITAVDRQNISTPRQFRDAMKKANLKKGVIVNVLSGRTAHFLILKEGED